jgi:hypothetical protein
MTTGTPSHQGTQSRCNGREAGVCCSSGEPMCSWAPQAGVAPKLQEKGERSRPQSPAGRVESENEWNG